MIVVVAPYSPPSRSMNPNLGAARKIEAVIKALSLFDDEVVLINSAHEGVVSGGVRIESVDVTGVKVLEITPPVYKRRQFGKLINLFDVDIVLSELKRLGSPRIVWFYNGYAFEMMLALRLRASSQAKFIIEFEDWHFSRSRGLNPKPYVDFFFWKRAMKVMDGGFGVNAKLVEQLRKYIERVNLLPGLVSPDLSLALDSEVEPFSSRANVNVGFFSGLTAEKGAGLVLDLVRRFANMGFHFHVTGAGGLAEEFKRLSSQMPECLTYYGRVEDSKLVEVILGCDVILNPHSPITKMDGGVFPFKVIEAVASARLLISTEVDGDGLDDVLQGVQFCAHGLDDFYAALIGSRSYYESRKSIVRAGALAANSRFGQQAFLRSISEMCREAA